MQQEQKKQLTPSTRCIQNLTVDTGFTKTGLEPEAYKKYESAQAKHLVEVLSQCESDLFIQNQVS